MEWGHKVPDSFDPSVRSYLSVFKLSIGLVLFVLKGASSNNKGVRHDAFKHSTN